MLGKLIKHELKATGRWFLPIYVLALLLALLERFNIYHVENAIHLQPPFDRLASIFVFIITFSFVVTLIAIAAAAFILVIYRFYKNLVTNEGYLMHVLPVKTSSLIWSKAIAAILWTLASIFVIFLSITLLFIGTGEWAEFCHSLKELFTAMMEALNYYHLTGSAWLFGIEGILLAIFMILENIFMLYASISIGQLVNNHKILGGFGAYFVINFVLQIVGGTAIFPVANHIVNATTVNEVAAHVINLYMPVLLLETAALAAVFYFITSYIFKNKLNLE